jgi:choline monooxygenase
VPFPFDPHLETAASLPARMYTDPAILTLEKERIFRRTWQLVGRVDQVRAPGDFLTSEVAGQPIVVVRDGETLRAFHNVCMHRAGPVAEGCGRRKSLQCRYHGWTYSLAGQLVRAPEMEGTAGFSLEATRLHAVHVGTWGGLVFANLAQDPVPLATFLEDIPERAAHFGADAMKHTMRREYVIGCNWKVYVDNYLEGYHLPMVHPGLYRELDYDRYDVELHRYYSEQMAPLRPVDSSGPAGTSGGRKYVPTATDGEARYFWLFPNLMLNVYFGQMQTNLIVPLGPERTLTVFDWFGAEGESEIDRQKLADFSHEIQVEDIGICEAVQKNLAAGVYERGRYSVKREAGVHHFHGLLHHFLS